MNKPFSFLVALTFAITAISCGTPANLPPKEEGTDLSESGYAIYRHQVKRTEAMTYSNMYEYLKSRIAGVEILPGDKIRIRGPKSLNSSNEPLLIVDGMEQSDLYDVDPLLVESVEVLKDGSTALYGVKGANGVIIITTIH